MAKEHQTIKIWKSTLQNLRRLYAVSGTPMIQIIDKLVSKEVEAFEKEKGSGPNAGEIKRIT